jgi:hypothetical protein
MATAAQVREIEQLAAMMSYGFNRMEKMAKRLRDQYPDVVDEILPMIEQAHELTAKVAALADAGTPNLETPMLRSAGGDKPKGGKK